MSGISEEDTRRKTFMHDCYLFLRSPEFPLVYICALEYIERVNNPH
jgi:hypothetical protein